MSALFDLVWLVLLVLFLPYIIVGVVLGKIAITVGELFYLPVLGGALGVGGLAVITWFNRVPDDSRPFASVVEVIAQSKIVGVEMPYILLVVALLLFGISLSKTLRKNHR